MISRRHITVLPTEGWECGHLEVEGKRVMLINILRVRLLICDPEQQVSLWLIILDHHSSQLCQLISELLLCIVVRGIRSSPLWATLIA